MSNKISHCISDSSTIKEGLARINDLDGDAIFVVDNTEKVLGAVTDGDIRRGLLNDLNLSDALTKVMNPSFRHLKQNEFTLENIDALKEQKVQIIPIITKEGQLHKLINLKKFRSFLPIQALLMAGGRGERLRPLTDELPKPLLKVGDKPIIEHNIDRLALYGIEKIAISVKYKSELIETYFKDGEEKGININYIHEDEPLGTIGAISKLSPISTDAVLVMNSDLLTNINYEDFYRFFNENDADMVVASIPYKVDIPYGVLETKNDLIISLKEKPSYTYYSNGGIYLIKTSLLDRVPKETFYNATDLMDNLIADGKKVLNYPIIHYWLDIGKHEDFQKAQEDIKHIQW